MAGLAERLESIARDRQQAADRCREDLLDPRKNGKGIASNMLAGHLKLLAVASYAVDRDVQQFRSLLRESALLRADLYDRFTAGEPIDESYVSLMGYKLLFDALACGDLKLAHRIASQIGGRPQIERKYDAPFTRAIGSALKHLVLGSGTVARSAVSAFEEACRTKGNADFAGYAICMQAILDVDAEALGIGIAAALSSHFRLCSRNRVFHLTPDEAICTWILGLVNLAIGRRSSVRIDHPLVPEALIAAGLESSTDGSPSANY